MRLYKAPSCFRTRVNAKFPRVSCSCLDNLLYRDTHEHKRELSQLWRLSAKDRTRESRRICTTNWNMLKTPGFGRGARCGSGVLLLKD